MTIIKTSSEGNEKKEMTVNNTYYKRRMFINIKESAIRQEHKQQTRNLDNLC